MTLGEFRALPILSSQFPIVFESGARWNTFSGICTACKNELTGDQIRGHVTRPYQGYLIDAWGLCSCGKLSRFSYRMMPDFSIVGRSPIDNKWSIWKPIRKTSLWRRFLRLFS